MILGGDEFGRSQHGNNNAYCQDSEISWFNWEWKDKQQELLEFTKKIISLRKENPALSRNKFFSGEVAVEGKIPELSWFSSQGSLMQEGNWADGGIKNLGMHFFSSQHPGDVFLLLMNASHEDAEFKLPPENYGHGWQLLVDTSGNKENPAEVYPLKSRSLALLKGAL